MEIVLYNDENVWSICLWKGTTIRLHYQSSKKGEKDIKRKHLCKKKNSDVSLELLYIAFEIQWVNIS